MLAIFFWRWILKDLIELSLKKKKVVVLCSRSPHFHVVAVQWPQGNVKKKKGAKHVHSCCFANVSLLLFCRSRSRRRLRCLISLIFSGLRNSRFSSRETRIVFSRRVARNKMWIQDWVKGAWDDVYSSCLPAVLLCVFTSICKILKRFASYRIHPTGPPFSTSSRKFYWA